MGVGVAGVLFIIAVNIVPTLARRPRTCPCLGRLTRSVRVGGGHRQGPRPDLAGHVGDAAAPRGHSTSLTGSKDAVNIVRPLVGYGPEAMWVAFNPFYPPDLAHVEARNASPDRSHNETWDSLVIAGLSGLRRLYERLHRHLLLGPPVAAPDRENAGILILFAALLTGFTLLSVGGFYYFDDRQLRLFGVALPFGLDVRLYGFYISIAASSTATCARIAPICPGRCGLALLWLWSAHYLEIHFGIAIGAARTHFWSSPAMLLVIGMRLAQVVPAEVQETAPEPPPAATGRVSEPVSTPAATAGKGGKGKGKGQPLPQTQSRSAATAQRARAALTAVCSSYLPPS